MSEFQIAEAKGFAKRKESIAPELYEKIRDVVYSQLRKNPYFGANIKKLKGELHHITASGLAIIGCFTRLKRTRCLWLWWI